MWNQEGQIDDRFDSIPLTGTPVQDVIKPESFSGVLEHCECLSIVFYAQEIHKQ